MMGGGPAQDLLVVRGLQISFGGGNYVVDGIDLTLSAGRLLCLVGESGSGKSLTALSLMRLLPPRATLGAREFRFDGIDILGLSKTQMEQLRGDRIAMIFQEPMTSLNPIMNIGDQIAESLVIHRGTSRNEALEVAVRLLERVKIPAARERMRAFPHELSGGMRQRVMIAMALSCRPALLIADEPTTALDVTIQSQILSLIDELRDELGSAVLFITHNLAVVAEIADEIAVMYAGKIVERGSRSEIFDDPLHPYTLALFAAIPRQGDVGERLATIDGLVPAPGSRQGCSFMPRCPFASEKCRLEAPPLVTLDGHHEVACWHAPLENHMR